MSSEANEELFGKDAELARSGYTPMPQSAPEPAEPEINLETAVEQRAAVTGEDSPMPLQYNQPNPDGSRSNERSPENLSLSPEAAAKDLGAYRRGIQETEQALRDLALSEELEKLRSPLMAEVNQTLADAEKAVDANAAHEAAQTQQPQAQHADQDVSRILQENPRLMEMISEQRRQDLAQGNQAIETSVQFIHDNGQLATMGLFVNFPELASLRSWQELPVALNIMAHQNPERHAQAMKYINGVQNLWQQSAQVQQQQQQRAAQDHQARWSQWSVEEDSKFVTSHPEFADPQQAPVLTQRAFNYMRNIGFTDQDIAAAWNGAAHVSARDSRVQWEAAVSRFALKPKHERVAALQKCDEWLTYDAKPTKEYASMWQRKRNLENLHWRLCALDR